MDSDNESQDSPTGEQVDAHAAEKSAGDALPEGWGAFKLRQIGDALTDASDLLTRKALEMQRVDAVVSEQLQREANAIGQRGIWYKFAAEEAELNSCPTCFHAYHEGRCKDSDDVGLPWDRPCDCGGSNPSAGTDHPGLDK